MPAECLQLFTWQELEKIICGSTVDIQLLKQHTRYENCNRNQVHTEYRMTQGSLSVSIPVHSVSFSLSFSPGTVVVEASSFLFVGIAVFSHTRKLLLCFANASSSSLFCSPSVIDTCGVTCDDS